MLMTVVVVTLADRTNAFDLLMFCC